MPRFERADCPETPFPVPALENARCGFLIAPEDRSKPNGRTIRSAVAIVPAESDTPAPDPVVYMAGGPGAAAILQTQLLVDLGFNRNRDLIVMAQRATLFSDPQLTCREYDRVRSQVHRVYDSGSFGRMQVAAVRECHRGFVARGIDVGAYNTTENAADFADLRRVLGIAEWNVFGFSYGTDLALTYMRDHPEGIRSFTIDSVVPPHLASLSRAWISVDEAFHNLFRACAAQRLCDDRYPRLGRTFAQQVRKLEADPLRTRATPPGGDRPVRVTIDGGTLVNWLVHALDDAAPSIPSAIHELANGNPRQIAEARAALAGHPESLGLFGWGLAFGVVCGEWVPYEPASEIVRQGRRAFPSFPRSVLAQAPQFPFFPQICRVWDVPPQPISQRAVTRSAIPSLVLSGTFDAATGRHLGEYAARTLSNSTFVTVPGVGHGVVFASRCAKRVLTSFLSSPMAPKTGCVAALRPAPFTVD